jgi:hypothetical protein
MPLEERILDRLTALEVAFTAHVAAEDIVLRRIQCSLDSLLASRTFVRGMIRMVVIISSVVSGLVTMGIMYFKR